MFVSPESLERRGLDPKLHPLRDLPSPPSEDGKEFKYLLEVPRAGLCAEFWRDAKTTLMPFLDPTVYGRSTLEGASFLVSSAFADERLHGRAFQPRLSVLTVEYLHLWTIAVAGERPFRLEAAGGLEAAGRLALAFAPRLHGWLFTRGSAERNLRAADGRVERVRVPPGGLAFRFLGHTTVVYRNPKRVDTFGPRAVGPVGHILVARDGSSRRVPGGSIPAPLAQRVRDGA